VTKEFESCEEKKKRPGLWFWKKGVQTKGEKTGNPDTNMLPKRIGGLCMEKIRQKKKSARGQANFPGHCTRRAMGVQNLSKKGSPG